MRRALVVALVVLFAAPQAAYAGTVSLGSVNIDYKYQDRAASMEFRASAGERNQIVVTRASTGALVLHDAGAPVIATAGCTPGDQHTVSCPAGYLDVDVGDGDDVVTLRTGTERPAGGYVRGGDGSDVLAGAGFLAGGPGNDVLTCPEPCGGSVLAGGGGDDRLVGGSTGDLLSGDGDGPPTLVAYETRLSDAVGPGSDVIDGGPGRDRLTFRGRGAGVRVDLGAGEAGTGPERDRVAGVEDVNGGDGDDLLLGDDAGNVLQGESGDDRIDGGGGNDYVLGNLIPDNDDFSPGYTPPDPGIDTLRGGAGDDRLDAGSERGDALYGGPGDDVLEDGLGGQRGTRASRVRCGGGRDTIAFAPQSQLLSDCELLRQMRSHVRITLRPQLRAGGRLRFAFTCLRQDGCAIALGLRVRASSPLTRRALSTQGPARRAFLMRPRPAARRGDVADITIIVGPGDPPHAARWRVAL